ncbi:SGNH/GDSL hydrolase family protein [Opitutales bacterium]|nr:SGNH/GDSL hydrolase family protein [Opitutales bacterium]
MFATLLPISLGCLLLLLKKRHLLRFFGCVSLCLGISLGATLHFRWDSFSIHFSDLPKDPSPDKLSVLFVGDSITCEGARPRGFITKIRSVLPIEHQVVCQKGATSIEIIRLLENASLPLDPAFIIAQSGINDLLNGCTQDQVFRSQAMLLEKLSTKFPQAKVYFLPIHPLKLANRTISEFPSLAPANFPVWWEDHSSFVQNSIVADGVHLSAHGHSDLAKAIVHKIFSENS